MDSYILKNSNPECKVTLIEGVNKELLEGFTAYKCWLSTLQNSIDLQKQEDHRFHKDPYRLEAINIESVTMFGKSKIGFLKLSATIKNSKGPMPCTVFLRGGSVAILVRNGLSV